MQSKHAYMNGRCAFGRGEQLDANPYQAGSTDAYAWQAGMMDAYQESRIIELAQQAGDQPAPDSRTDYYIVCIANLKKQQQSRGSLSGFALHHPPHKTIQ